jgi:hypothetical protein
MGLYNFQERFVLPIQNGTKTQTIRAPRNMKEDVPGNTMHLWHGLRQPGAKRIARFECVEVEEIEIFLRYDRPRTTVDECASWVVRIDDVLLDADQRDLFAWHDGFRHPDLGVLGKEIGSFDLMMEFWKGRLPFHGHIFHWKYDPRRLG